jgi:hypothetical protein
VNDILRRQSKRWCDPRFSGWTPANRAHRFSELGSGGAVDCAVDSASRNERIVGGIDDGIDAQLGYVTMQRANQHETSPLAPA